MPLVTVSRKRAAVLAVVCLFEVVSTGLLRANDYIRAVYRHAVKENGLIVRGTHIDYDANHCFTTIPGPYAAYLLSCYELTGDAWFRDVAVSCLKAYHKWGYDPEAHTYHAMLKLDGRPVPEQSRGAGYEATQGVGILLHALLELDLLPTRWQHAL